MSDNIPFEIQAEIMKSFPVKSLMQFRSVSKKWKSHIDSSDFITHYSSQQQHLLVTYDDPENSQKRYVSIADDDAFPQHKVSPTIPNLVRTLINSVIIGFSHGLFCLYYDDPEPIAIFWNLLIGKSVAVVVPNVAPFGKYNTVIGFGVCSKTMNPKIVKITQIDDWSDLDTKMDTYMNTDIPWQVEVFTLNTGKWRSPRGILPRKSIHFDLDSIFIDGMLYWLATDIVNTLRGFLHYHIIISFDVTTEEFGDVYLPTTLANMFDNSLSVSKLRNNLVVLETYRDDSGIGVWMMVDGVYESFVRIFKLNSLDACVRGFRKTGEPIFEIVEHHCGKRHGSSLVVYNPYTQVVINLEMNVLDYPFCVYPYAETLLLLDHPDFIIYDQGKAIHCEEQTAFEAYKQGESLDTFWEFWFEKARLE